MSIETNKQTALRILDATAAHDAQVFDECLHEDASFWTCGKPHLFPAAGRKSKAEVVAYMATPSPFQGGGVYSISTIIGEDDTVLIEAQNNGKAFDGRVYGNTYLYLFTFKDDRVIQIKEYFDTLAALDFFASTVDQNRGGCAISNHVMPA